MIIFVGYNMSSLTAVSIQLWKTPSLGDRIIDFALKLNNDEFGVIFINEPISSEKVSLLRQYPMVSKDVFICVDGMYFKRGTDTYLHKIVLIGQCWYNV